MMVAWVVGGPHDGERIECRELRPVIQLCDPQAQMFRSLEELAETVTFTTTSYVLRRGYDGEHFYLPTREAQVRERPGVPPR